MTHGPAALLRRETLEKLFRSMSIPALAEAVDGRIPDDIDRDADLSSLRLSQLLRFLTVRSMAGYIGFLLVTSDNGASDAR